MLALGAILWRFRWFVLSDGLLVLTCFAVALLSAGRKVQRSFLHVITIHELHMMRRIL
jgi:hypothetical protein